LRVLLGAWFSLPRLGSEHFSSLMKQGVKYDRALGFKIDAGTDVGAALRTLSTALGEGVELNLRCLVCVKGGTLILGDNKEIRHSMSMDKSLGISGVSSIKQRFSRKYKGPLIRIKAVGVLPIEITPEHPMLVSRSLTRRKRVGKSRLQMRSFSAIQWKEAGSLEPKKEGNDGDYLFIPRLPGSATHGYLDLASFTNDNGRRVCAGKQIPLNIPLNADTAWLIGIYVAEGFPSSSAACFALNHDERELQQKIIRIGEEIGYSPSKDRKATSTVVIIPSRILSRALAAWCGKGANHKRVPEFILLHKNASILKSFLEGYLSGDGYVAQDSSIMSTTSKVLALQVQLLAARLGSFVTISRVESGSSVVDGREIRGNPNGKYVLEMRPRGSQSFAKVTELGILTPVRSVRSLAYDGRVYNIETADNTYLVSNAVVHNCGKEACPGCLYSSFCDRSKVSSACLCAEHSSGPGAFELYQKTFAENLVS
jgi:intein/homing endonuclease